MKANDLHEALTEVSEKYVEASRPGSVVSRGRRPLKRVLGIAAAAAAALALGFGIFAAVRALSPESGANAPVAHADEPMQKPDEPTRSATPTTPAASDIPAGDIDSAAAGVPVYPVSRRPGVSEAGLRPFYEDLTEAFFADEEGNGLLSPFSVYTALSMLAESTEGSTRAEILEALRCPDMDTLRTTTRSLIYDEYTTRDNCVIKPSASIWLSDALRYNEEAVKRLSEDHAAYTFSGKMGSGEYDELMRSWTNTMTGGLLSDQVSNFSTDELDAFHIITTLYYKVAWDAPFRREATSTEVFHAKDGDRQAEFMHGGGSLYFEGEGYKAVSRRMEHGSVWFILPDEGVELSELGARALEPVFETEAVNRLNSEHTYIISLAVPKFDIEEEAELTGTIRKLGINECFDPSAADMSGLLVNAANASVSRVDHGVRVRMNEEGVEAAAYTHMPVPGAAEPKDIIEIDMKLDRPFMFVICDGTTPLFIGSVAEP